MATLLDYAVLSAAVYDDVRADPNKVVLPSGWTTIGIVPSALGFAAAAYQDGNDKNDIVISYEGTDTDTTANSVADWLGANIPAGVGIGSTQIIQAALFYEQIKADNPNASITFTGHSLGGGLASLMSVFFDRPATTFDEAPFALSAINPVFIAALEAALIANNYSDSSFNAFFAASATGVILLPLAVGALAALVATRESNVTTYDISGEVLSSIRNAITAIYGGADNSIPVGSSLLTSDPSIPAVTLHSIILLSALEISKTFQTDTLNLPNLLPAIFNSSLYYASPYQATNPTAKQDFLTKLLNAQIPLISNQSQGLLSLFAQDMAKLGVPSTTGSANALDKALIATAIEDYYFMDPASGKSFFKAIANGVSFNLNDIALAGATSKAKPLLYRAAESYLATFDSFAQGIIESAANWFVESASGGMTADGTGIIGADVMIGGTYRDPLKGGSGDNVLIAGDGNDVLIGGSAQNYIQAGFGSHRVRRRECHSDALSMLNLPCLAVPTGSMRCWPVRCSIIYVTATKLLRASPRRPDRRAAPWRGNHPQTTGQAKPAVHQQCTANESAQ